MYFPLIVLILSSIFMIISILIFPKIKIGKVTLSTYWIVVLFFALILIIFRGVSFDSIISSFTSNDSINPIKILVLFISMSLLSIFLDEVGFFARLATITLKKAKSSQTILFFLLYLIVSILTVFTSNDIIILSFTPFIIYFAKNAKINPIPFLTLEFVAANTWSMALIIGNPTNIYLATSQSIDFMYYIKIMILPTIAGGLLSLGLLYLLFRKDLKKSIDPEINDVKISDKTSFIISLTILIITTILLAISSYIKLEMYLVSLLALVFEIIVLLMVSLFKKKKPTIILNSLKRAPYELIPFVLSMFIIILSLKECGLTSKIATLFANLNPTYAYGISSFFAANIINNIPMSVLYSAILEYTEGVSLTKALFATIIGSNISAFFSPLGALAGIMFSSIINKHGIKYSFFDFLKKGIIISLPTILISLFVLELVL